MTSHLRVRIPSPTSLVLLRCLVVSACVRRQTDDLREHDSHGKKDNDDDNDNQHNNSFQFINLQAIISSAYYKVIKLAQRHKTKKLYKHTQKTQKNETKIVR